ncbi:hypothetical protein REPUB_Repub05bG0024800 [Reevesia pubescens]
MDHQVTQLDDGDETASAFETVLAMVLLPLLLPFIWRFCCSCYHNHVKKHLSFSFTSSSAINMEPTKIADVERILNYTFKDKSLLVEALTHTSCCENMSYERLEFLGDAALGIAVATHFFSLDPKLNSGQLSKLREESVNNEKLEQVAAKHRLYWFVRRINTASLDHDVKKYEETLKQGDDQNITDTYPDILADIVESLAGAVYLDVNSDLTKLRMIFKDMLGLDEIMPPKNEGDGSSEINGAQAKLYAICGKRKWKKPIYSLVKAEGCPHEMKYVYSVGIVIEDHVLQTNGNEKSTVKDAKNSAAYLLIHDLKESGII